MPIHHHRMAGIGSALETGDNVRLRGEVIHNFALALIPPL